ncbi:hypothetical protein BDW68DRAFT_26738 [Aspergillus falconensis]
MPTRTSVSLPLIQRDFCLLANGREASSERPRRDSAEAPKSDKGAWAPSLKQKACASPSQNHPGCNAILPVSGLSDQHPSAYQAQGSSWGSLIFGPFMSLI